MNYDLSKHKLLRGLVVAELQGIPELPGGAWNARINPFSDDETEYPVASVFTGNDSAEETEDEANLRREYDIDVVVISKGHDVTDTQSGEDSFIDLADDAMAAIEQKLVKFRYTLGANVYRLKYLRSNPVIDDGGELYTHVRVMSFQAHSIEKKVQDV